MPRVRSTLPDRWEPTPQQREAARLLAACATWQHTADRVGVKSLQTIQNWLAIPGFTALRDAYAQKFDEYLEGEVTASLGEMFETWRRYVRGEIPGDDKRIEHIRPTVIKYIERFYNVVEAPVPAEPARTAIQINVGRESAPPE